MQELQSVLMLWRDALVEYTRTHPDDVSAALIASLFAFIMLLWLSVRSHARLRKENQKLTSSLVALQKVEVSVVPLEPQGVASETIPQPSLVLEHEAVVTSADLSVPAPPTETPRSAVVRGLTKSRTGLLGRLASVFAGKSSLNLSMLDDLEEVLILSDVGARCAAELVASVKAVAESDSNVTSGHLKGLLKQGIRDRLLTVPEDHRMYQPHGSPMVILVVGVNGVGKTTTVAKLAAQYIDQKKKVLVIAADTFRAAAVEQLAEWSNRVGFTLIRGPEGSKPGAVVFDGVAAAKDGGYDVVLIDTAGRLHTKSNLMQELEGIRNSIRKHIPDAPHETVLVVDGVSGQNALVQAREFNAAVQLSGVVVTKLDGTPKGGIIVAISHELRVPVLFIGVGEKVSDLLRFDRGSFVEALFDEDVDRQDLAEESLSAISALPQSQVVAGG